MAFKGKVTFKKTRGADQVIAARIDSARSLAAKTITDEVAEFVKDLIPRQGGWFDIYREAITYFSTKKGTKWAVSGLWPKEYTAFPADSTLLDFKAPDPLTGGDSSIAGVLASYNPWTVDRLPALMGGIQVEATARPASSSEVDAQRERLIAAETAIKSALTSVGGRIEEGGVPRIVGVVYADVVFMAKALEHGLAGLPRTPHWVKALRAVHADAGSWVAPVKDRIARVLNGEDTFSADGQAMPRALERKIGL